MIYTVTLLLTKINCMQSFLINMLIRKGHGFCGSVVFSLLLLSLGSSNSTNYTKPWVSTRRTSLNTSLLINSALRVENLKFAVRPTPNLASKAWENCSSNNGADSIINKPLSSWSQWTKACLNDSIIVHPLLSQRVFFRIKIKRAKRPCTYYSNSSATFHCLFEGDLVFKLNPGPSNNEIGSCQRQRIPPLNYYRNPVNLISITRRLILKKNCFSAWASTLNMGLINKVDMVCLSPVGYGV